MIRAAVFDLDGTIVDSNDLHAQAWQEAFRHFGREIPYHELRAQVGKGSDHYLPAFLNEVELRELGTKIDEFRGQIFKKKYLPRVRPFPRVRELFERLKSHGKKIALASSGKEEEVAYYQQLVGIKGLVDSQTTMDEVAHSKPSPDVFLAALRRLDHLAPEEAVAVGDTPYDVQAAKKTGLPIIALLCVGFPEAELREGAIAIFRDPAHLLENYHRSPLAG